MLERFAQTTHSCQGSMNNISERLRFLVNTQDMPAGPDDTVRRGEARTLAMLERRTGIAQSRWRDFTRGKSRANEELIEAACKLWPWFAIWLATGSALEVENLSPLDQAEHSDAQRDDVVLRRAKTPSGPNEISIPHALKLRTPDAVGTTRPTLRGALRST